MRFKKGLKDAEILSRKIMININLKLGSLKEQTVNPVVSPGRSYK